MSVRPSRLLWSAWVLSAAWAAGPVRAGLPTVRATVDTHAVVLGDRISLSLELCYPRGTQPQLPDLEAWLHGLAAGSPRQQPAVDTPDGTTLRYVAALQFFALGVQEVPSLEVGFITAHGDTLWRRTEPVAVQVTGIREEGDDEPRDIKPPVRVPGGIQLWVVLVVCLLVVALAAALLYHWMMRRGRAEPRIPPPPPIDHAAEFARIAALGLLKRGEVKLYYSLLADNLRRYLEQRLGIAAMERTTDEVLRDLQGAGLDSRMLGDIRGFLRVADLVKFARMVPDLEAAQGVPETGIGLVRRIDMWEARRRAAQAADTAGGESERGRIDGGDGAAGPAVPVAGLAEP